MVDLSTPVRAKIADLATPVRRTTLEVGTPPCAPMPFPKQLHDEIAVALHTGSKTSLCMALLQRHCCGDDHGIHEAVRWHHLQALESLLADSSVKQADAHCRGRRPLHGAVETCMSKGSVGYKMLKALLVAGASANYVEGDSASLGAPLHIAVKRGCLDAVALLLMHGADPNFCDANVHTPLHMSCCLVTFSQTGLEEKFVDLLLSHGACPVAADPLGHKPGHCTFNLSLQRKLEKAVQWWARQQLSLAVNSSAEAEQQQEETQKEEPHVQVALLQPEIFEAVIACL